MSNDQWRAEVERLAAKRRFRAAFINAAIWTACAVVIAFAIFGVGVRG